MPPGSTLAFGPEEAESSTVLSIIAVEPGGNAVAAAITLEDDRGSRVLGRTFPDRPLRVSADELQLPARVFAATESEPGRIGQRLLLGLPVEDPLVVQVAPACVVSGRIVAPPGTTESVEFRVLAVDGLFRTGWSSSARMGDSLVPDGKWDQAVAGTDGRFELNGLREGRFYALFASGSDGTWIDADPDPFRRYECGEHEVQLPVQPVYGAVLGFENAELQRYVRACRREGIAVFRRTSREGRSFDLAGHAALQGTPIANQASEAGKFGDLVLAIASSSAVVAETATQSIELLLPFAPPVAQTVELPRVTDELSTIKLSPAVSLGTMGKVTLWVHSDPAPLARLSADTEVAMLRMQSLALASGQSGAPLELRLTASQALEGRTIDVLPIGRYEWELRSHGTKLLPREGGRGIMDVTAEGADLVLDLSWTGAAEIRAADPDGIAASGPLQADLRDLGSMEVTTMPGGVEVRTYDEEAISMAWTAAPYVFPFVPPGSYSASMRGGFNRRMTGAIQGPIDVQAGATTKAEIRATRF